MKRIIVVLCVSLFYMTTMAQDQNQSQNQPQNQSQSPAANQVVSLNPSPGKSQIQDADQEINDYNIVSDEVVDGVRCIVATPSAKVCSKQIDIRIKDGIIQSVVYTRGCEGNAKGLGALLKDMTVEEAIKRLEGITCGKRGTSCPDQLARILKTLK